MYELDDGQSKREFYYHESNNKLEKQHWKWRFYVTLYVCVTILFINFNRKQKKNTIISGFSSFILAAWLFTSFVLLASQTQRSLSQAPQRLFTFICPVIGWFQHDNINWISSHPFFFKQKNKLSISLVFLHPAWCVSDPGGASWNNIRLFGLVLFQSGFFLSRAVSAHASQACFGRPDYHLATALILQ